MSARLLADAMLGSLTTYLRFLGHDTVYAPDEGAGADEELRRLARAADRALVTRDRALADRTDRSYLLTERAVEDQLAELGAAGLELSVPDAPTRCGGCNGRLRAVPEGATTPEYAPAVGELDGDGRVWRCLDCDQHFWKGSHWARMRETVAAARE